MDQYYTKTLSAQRLKRCYDIASPRVKRFLDSEIRHTTKIVGGSDLVLELGCGYGRVMKGISESIEEVIGIDTSLESLIYGKRYLSDCNNYNLYQMNATELGFRNNSFDAVLCIQNGISAFGKNPKDLILESIRVTKPDGVCVFSSYSHKFWNHRIEWFEDQAAEGLLGEIDYEKTKNGVIVCKDGFRAVTFNTRDFELLIQQLNLSAEIVEVDDSSLFCEIYKEE
ncbi:MAG: class I SAM-dependent methyltransferase [Candidatus Thorarchaeota archaeon]|jgi:2-polyprenyl-6-hydroxyphenyl methylase/3-demethylubiquinone-9 3-methyltransferase